MGVAGVSSLEKSGELVLNRRQINPQAPHYQSIINENVTLPGGHKIQGKS